MAIAAGIIDEFKEGLPNQQMPSPQERQRQVELEKLQEEQRRKAEEQARRARQHDRLSPSPEFRLPGVQEVGDGFAGMLRSLSEWVHPPSEAGG